MTMPPFKLVAVVPGEVTRDDPDVRWATLTFEREDMPGRVAARFLIQVRIPKQAEGPNVLATAVDMATFWASDLPAELVRLDQNHPVDPTYP